VILEGIVTTTNEDGSTNISPMGPDIEDPVHTFQLRPFTSSTTYRNLLRDREGVLHVIDDVLLLAQAAIGQLDPRPELVATTAVRGHILKNCCRWYAFRVVEIEDHEPRASMRCQVVDTGNRRNFFGFNRAKHAIVELAILATRVHLLPRAEIVHEFDRWEPVVLKTGGPREQEAFVLLRRYVSDGPANGVTWHSV
jgi:hypothetical protein